MAGDPYKAGLEALRALPRRTGEYFLPIGQNCSLSWYMKAVGAQSESYPFDWVFSSPGIVADCIETRFAHFLDPAEHFELENGPAPSGHMRAGHRRYHNAMFNHRSPIPEADLAYYGRCVARFLAVWDSDQPVTLVSMALPEHAKRQAWAGGFVEEFPVPTNTSPVAEYDGVLAQARRRPAPTRLVVVEQHTEGRPALDCDCEEETVSVRFVTQGPNDGVRFARPRDDDAARRLFAALTGRPTPTYSARDRLRRMLGRV